MHHHDTPSRLPEASLAQALWESSPSSIAEVSDVERHASEGCSACARALVNAREAAVEMALGGAPPRPPPERLRRSILDRARRAMSAQAGPQAAQAAPEKRHPLDPSGALAHRHITLPGEEERAREIDALRATEPRPGEGTARMLSQLARFVDFRIHFVSIVQGERVSYRVQRGLPEGFAALRELRREMSYCTHCVSAGGPFVVENAAAEPFFRGSRAVTRFGVTSYAGVPLRTARGVAIGTLCALDFAPRAISAEITALLEVFSRRAAAEIERERTPERLAEVVLAASDQGDVYAAGFFGDLLSVERRRSPGSALLTVRAGEPAELLAWIEQDEAAGRIDGELFGIVIPGAELAVAEERFARLRSAAGPSALGVALAGAGGASPADWIARAAGAST